MELVHSIRPNKGGEGAPLLTCNTCGLGFPTSELQRSHMKTEWHRYNLRRRVASLPPISSEVFAEKVLLQQNRNAWDDGTTGRGSSGRSSGQRQVTKKDKKKEEKLLRKEAAKNASRDYSRRSANSSGAAANSNSGNIRGVSPARSESSVASSTFSLGEPAAKVEYAPSITTDEEDVDLDDASLDDWEGSDSESINKGRVGIERKTTPDLDDEDSDNNETLLQSEIDRKLSSGVQFAPNVCFMDDKQFATVDDNVAYLSKQYGLYIPEQDYLVDLPGLITYFGEKVGIGNMCLFCGFEGRSLESVRAHMLAKSHVKVPYDSVEDKLEISEFYDFRPSYRKSGKARRAKRVVEAEGTEDDGWVDEDDDLENDNDEDGDDDDDDLDDAAYVDASGYQLVIAPGVTVGHRSLQRYYKQSFRPIGPAKEGQSTVLAVDRRSQGLLMSSDPVQAKQQKLVWKEENKQRRQANRITLTTNFQRHYRDELLQ